MKEVRSNMEAASADDSGMAPKRMEAKYREYTGLVAQIYAMEKERHITRDSKQSALLHQMCTHLREKMTHMKSELAGVDTSLFEAGPTLRKDDAKWDRERNCSNLANFIEAISAQKELILHPEPRTVISLEGNVAWLGMPSIMTAHLYVRPCYPELLKARELAIDTEVTRNAHHYDGARWEKGCKGVFTGSSGIGKCHLAALVVAQALMKGTEVLLECLEGSMAHGQQAIFTQEAGNPAFAQRHYYWLTRSGKVDHTMDIREVQSRLYENQEYLKPVIHVAIGCDSGLRPQTTSWVGHTYIFCSHNRDLLRPLRKAYNYFLYFNVPALELDELLSMKKALPTYKNLREESVRRWHSWSGGSAKACLFLNGKEPNGPAAWQSEVRHVLAKASPGELLNMVRRDGQRLSGLEHEKGIAKSSNTSHSVCAQKDGGDAHTDDIMPLNRYKRAIGRIASRNVRNLILVKLGLGTTTGGALS